MYYFIDALTIRERDYSNALANVEDSTIEIASRDIIDFILLKYGCQNFESRLDSNSSLLSLWKKVVSRLVITQISNPENLKSESDGSYSYTRELDGSMFITPLEEQLLFGIKKRVFSGYIGGGLPSWRY